MARTGRKSLIHTQQQQPNNIVMSQSRQGGNQSEAKFALEVARSSTDEHHFEIKIFACSESENCQMEWQYLHMVTGIFDTGYLQDKEGRFP